MSHLFNQLRSRVARCRLRLVQRFFTTPACPVCGSAMDHFGISGSDLYCENCGYPDENRGASSVTRQCWLKVAPTPRTDPALRIEQCPQCGDRVTQTNLGDVTDDYCEECGWPDENRGASEVNNDD